MGAFWSASHPSTRAAAPRSASFALLPEKPRDIVSRHRSGDFVAALIGIEALQLDLDNIDAAQSAALSQRVLR
jgi:hypothetical protein